jgi:carboxymethylenebutenolidase
MLVFTSGGSEANNLALKGAQVERLLISAIEHPSVMEAAKAAGKTVEIVMYPDAPHGFHADYRPTYRADPAKDGWKRMLAWFKKNGVA